MGPNVIYVRVATWSARCEPAVHSTLLGAMGEGSWIGPFGHPLIGKFWESPELIPFDAEGFPGGRGEHIPGAGTRRIWEVEWKR